MFIADSLVIEGTVTDLSEAVRTISFRMRIVNQNGTEVATGKVLAEVLQ